MKLTKFYKTVKAIYQTLTVDDATLYFLIDTHELFLGNIQVNPVTAADKIKLDSIESGAQINVLCDWGQTDTTADDYIKNKPDLSVYATTLQLSDIEYVVATSLIDLSTNINTAVNNIIDISTQIIDVSSNVNNLALDISTLRNTVNDVSTAVSNVSTNVSNVSTAVSNISTNVSNVSTAVSNVSSALSDLSTNISTNYVQKEAGKGLSSNDYTTAEKNKLAGIDTSALTNVQADWNQTDNTSDDYIKNKPDLTVYATTQQLTDVEYVVATSLIDLSTNLNAAVNNIIDISTLIINVSSNVNSLAQDVSTLGNTVNNVSTAVSNVSTSVSNVSSAVSDLSTNVSTNYVRKESGKGLSSNDYTTAEKTKLAGIDVSALTNVQADWNQTDNTSDDYIKNKPDLTAYATTQQLINVEYTAAAALNNLNDRILANQYVITLNMTALLLDYPNLKVSYIREHTSADADDNIALSKFAPGYWLLLMGAGTFKCEIMFDSSTTYTYSGITRSSMAKTTLTVTLTDVSAGQPILAFTWS